MKLYNLEVLSFWKNIVRLSEVAFGFVYQQVQVFLRYAQAYVL